MKAANIPNSLVAITVWCSIFLLTLQASVPDLRSTEQPDCVDSFDEKSSSFWRKNAQKTLISQLAKQHNLNIAKNVVFFMGDGMSIPTVTTARIYYGQQQGLRGEDSRLSFEKFPHIGLSKTYCADAQVPDSACTATAYLGGVKGNYNTTGVNPRVAFEDCAAASDPANQVESIIAWAQRAGKATGIVTTTRLTNASPAGAYAHTSNRDFECDTDAINRGKDPLECEDNASQLVRGSTGNRLNVIFGGGRLEFIPNNETDVDGNVGKRSDGVNLIEEWKRNKVGAKVIFDRDGLTDLDLKRTKHVLGIFAKSHMDFNLDADRAKEPSLTLMTQRAIQLLQQNPKGFVLFVEGGRIDHGHHQTKAHKALDEAVQLSYAVERAQQITDPANTLIVVTADHAHTMSFNGYSKRGRNILGLARDLADSELPLDGKPYTILSYANGPAAHRTFERDGTRRNLTSVQFGKDHQYPAIAQVIQESHGGDDVGIFATGPHAHLFNGVLEQNVIPHIIGYAACIGSGRTACDEMCTPGTTCRPPARITTCE